MDSLAILVAAIGILHCTSKSRILKIELDADDNVSRLCNEITDHQVDDMNTSRTDHSDPPTGGLKDPRETTITLAGSS
jgi:hypothetical protein